MAMAKWLCFLFTSNRQIPRVNAKDTHTIVLVKIEMCVFKEETEPSTTR